MTDSADKLATSGTLPDFAGEVTVERGETTFTATLPITQELGPDGYVRAIGGEKKDEGVGKLSGKEDYGSARD